MFRAILMNACMHKWIGIASVSTPFWEISSRGPHINVRPPRREAPGSKNERIKFAVPKADNLVLTP